MVVVAALIYYLRRIPANKMLRRAVRVGRGLNGGLQHRTSLIKARELTLEHLPGEYCFVAVDWGGSCWSFKGSY